MSRSSSGPGRRPLKAEITGSNPVRDVFFLLKTRYFVVAHSVGYLRASARLRTVYLPRSRLELTRFSLKNLKLARVYETFFYYQNYLIFL